jgi:hypothetical protein
MVMSRSGVEDITLLSCSERCYLRLLQSRVDVWDTQDRLISGANLCDWVMLMQLSD